MLGTTPATTTASAATGLTGGLPTFGTSHGASSGASTATAQSGTTPSTSSFTGTNVSGGSTFTAGTFTSTTTKRCEEMQVVDESISKQITVSPTDVSQQVKPEFQPTSKQGVSFPENETKPTITVNFGKPAEVQSVTIPRDKTPNANVQQFQVTFYSPDGKKINDKAFVTNSSPKDDKTKPAHLGSTEIPSNAPVSHIEITILHTTDDKSPKAVVLDIIACTEATSGKFFLHTYTVDEY
jgi:hypothetical protein